MRAGAARPGPARPFFVRRVTVRESPVRFLVMTTSQMLDPTEAAVRSADRPVVVVAAADPAQRSLLAALLGDRPLTVRLVDGPHALLASHDAEPPAAVILALESTERSRIGIIRTLRARLGCAAIIVVATPAREHDVRLILGAGAEGLVLEADAAHALGPALSAVLAGQLSLPGQARRHAERSAFSHREKEVLAVMVTGATNRQIADALFLSESTVKSHLASAFAKLGVRSRAEAATVLAEDDDLDHIRIGSGGS